jgi:hypothetical protein
MATLRQAIDFAKQNPQDARSLELMKQIKSGGMDETARNEGIDLTGKSQTFQLQTPSFRERAGENIQERASNIVDAVQGVGEFKDTSLLKKGTGATAEAFGAISSTAYEALPETIRNVFDGVAGGIGQGFEFLTNKIGESKFLQEAVQGDTSKLEEALSIVSDLGIISGEVLGVQEGIVNTSGLARTTQKVASAGGRKVQQAGSKVKGSIKNIGDKTGISEAIPTPERLVESSATKALDLTQGDVKNISTSTGNQVGDWLAKNNLIGKNKDATRLIVQEFGDDAYIKVRSEIAKVDTKFTQANIPRYEQALKEILKKTDNTAGLEDVSVEVKGLLSKESPSLSDVQRVKELMDDQFNLYKVTGDVGESAAKKGLDQIRSEIREFIETQVDEFGGQDIRALNNNVATSRSLTKAISDRSTRGLTRSSVSIGDLGAFGIGSSFGGPLLGVAAVAGKKILESSAVRLRFAKWLDGLTDARKLKVAEELSKGNVPADMAKAIDFEVPVGSVTETIIEEANL